MLGFINVSSAAQIGCLSSHMHVEMLLPNESVHLLRVRRAANFCLASLNLATTGYKLLRVRNTGR